MQRALIVKLGAIGDVLMAIPAAYKLHGQGFQIDWIANPQAATVLRLYPFVRVIEADERTILQGSTVARIRALRQVWQQLGPGRYDLVATLYYDRRYRLLSLPVRAARHIRLSRESRTAQLLQGRHHTDEFARILQGATGLRRPDCGPEPCSLVPVAPALLPDSPLPPAVRVRVVLAAGGARNMLRDDALRRWTIGNYVELGRLLLLDGFEVVLTGGPGDTWVREAFAGMPCTDLIDRLSLPELLALFESSQAVVTHDSGPLHLAGVTSCALLGIFGPVDPWSRLPRRAGTAALWGGEGFACRPCYDGSRYADCSDNQCMAQITPRMAFETLLRMVAEKAAGTMRPAEVIQPRSSGPFVEIRTGALKL